MLSAIYQRTALMAEGGQIPACDLVHVSCRASNARTAPAQEETSGSRTTYNTIVEGPGGRRLGVSL